MAKTYFLQIRLTPNDRERIHEAAASEHLDDSTWARQVLLKELDRLLGQRERRTTRRAGS